MSDKIRFVTLHPLGTNVDLVKDEGQIPFTLYKEHGVDASIVVSKMDKDVDSSIVKGLKIIHYPFILHNEAITGIIYLIFNSKKIDWLNIYFAGRKAYIWTKLFKVANPNGKVYLKLDMDYRTCGKLDSNIKERVQFNKSVASADLVSVETENVRKRIQKYTDKEINIIGDGFNKLDFKPNIYQKRENSFITVGRLGTIQKATDILLEAFAISAKSHNWSLKLIGSIEENFKPYIDDYFKRFPELKNRVKFLGVINNRKIIYDEYCKSKCFVLTSRWESFALVGGEALSCGCRLIVTDSIPSSNIFTNDEKFGEIVPSNDVAGLSKAMVQATRYHYSQVQVRETVEYANNNFNWSKNCNKLYGLMKNT